MPIQSFVYPKPDNEIFFETLCRKVFSVYLKLPHLQKFARRGQEQFGVDLVSNTDERVVGIQCKLKNARAGLETEEVNLEIQKAKKFTPSLGEYIIATTADREPELQQHAIRVTQDHKAAGLFSVVVYAWQDLEEILKENPDLASELYAFNAAPISTASPATYTAVTSFQAVTGTSHAEIDEAARHFTEGRPDVSIALLERIKKERWEILGPREKFRVVANIGNAFYNKGDYEKAALAYFEAAAYQPRDDSDALSIAAHAYLLTGDREQAYRMASESCLQNPVNERGNLIRIASAPTNLSYDDLLAAIPEILRSNPNIALALHHRAMEANNPNEAEKILRPLKDLSPSLHFALGTALLQQGLPTGVRERMLCVTRDPDRVSEARDHFAAAMSSPDASPELIAAARYNRSLASMLLQDENEAFVDIRSAYDKEPENEEFGVALIAEALRREDKASGLPVARDLVTRNLKPGTRFIVSVALHNWGNDNEKREEFVLLKDGLVKLPGEPEELRLEYIRRIIYLAHFYGDLTDDLTEELAEQGESALEQSVMRSWALFRMSRRDDARVEALRAAACLGENASYTEKHEVALILTRLGLAEQALPIWLEVCPPQEFSEDTMHLLGSAEALDRDDVIISYCKDLRSNGIYAPEVAGKEIEVLEEYNELREAKAVIRQYLDANSD
ncbi:MAG TPA: hypothetical protein VGG20_02495, partial [Thermoanaerobaculia bacterium]